MVPPAPQLHLVPAHAATERVTPSESRVQANCFPQGSEPKAQCQQCGQHRMHWSCTAVSARPLSQSPQVTVQHRALGGSAPQLHFALFFVLSQTVPWQGGAIGGFDCVPRLGKDSATPAWPCLSTSIPSEMGCKKGRSQPMLMCCSEEHESSLESFFLSPPTFSLYCFSLVLQSHPAGYFPWTPTEVFKKKGTWLHALPASPRRHCHKTLSGFSLPSPKSSHFASAPTHGSACKLFRQQYKQRRTRTFHSCICFFVSNMQHGLNVSTAQL